MGVIMNSEINLVADNFLWEGNNFPAWSPATLSTDATNLMPKTLQRHQIALLVCKFVQAINSVSLGVPIWQQEWLESWAASLLVTWDRDERGITTRPEIACYCCLPVFLSSPLPPPFFSCPRLSLSLPFSNCVWLLETTPKGNCFGWEARNSPDACFITKQNGYRLSAKPSDLGDEICKVWGKMQH